MARRKCSECPNLLPENARPTQKTCSDACRNRRHRRLSKQKRTAGQASGEKTRIPDEWKELMKDVGHEVAKEELRPVVREAITEDAMKALQTMVDLLPKAVAGIQADLLDSDPVVHQKAQQMVLRYTLGHEKALPADEKQPPALNVNLTMPRPGQEAPDTAAGSSSTEIGEAVELRECDTCHLEKPLDEFFGLAPRCNDCVTKFQARAEALLEPPKPRGEEDD